MAEEGAAVFGIYSDRLSTANAVEALGTAGFRDTDIIAVFPDEIGTWHFSATTRTRLFEGTVAGGTAGLLIAGLAVWVLAAMSLLPVRFGLILIILTLGAGLGSMLGGLAGRRISRFEKRYEARVRKGDILVSVQCDNSESAGQAMEILQHTGADDVSVSDKVAVDFVKTNRILVRPISERTTASSLRLVTHENRRLEFNRLRRNVTKNQSARGRGQAGWGRRS